MRPGERDYLRIVTSVVGAFAPVARVLCLTPGPATALVIRSALRGGWTRALKTVLGNSLGILFWGIASVLGISALVAASEVAFAVLKVAGAVVLVYLGVQSLRSSRRRRVEQAAAPPARESTRSAFADGLLTSFANPKLAVFFVALLPQFIPDGTAVLPATLLMVAMVVACDCVWFSLLAVMVARARRAVSDHGIGRRMEQLTGGVLIALGLRLALERRVD